MTVRNPERYLQKQKEINSAVAERWALLEEYYLKKLWHQLTAQLKTDIYDASFTSGLDLYELYTGFISEFEHRINPVTLVEIARQIADWISVHKDVDQAIEFLEKIKLTVVNISPEATVLCLSTIASAKLVQLTTKNGGASAAGDVTRLKPVKLIIEEAQQILDSLTGVTATHGAFYKVSAQYLQVVGDHSNYYREALRYLGCVELSTLSKAEQEQFALSLSIAALLGEDVYNFGELLAHPILESLSSTSNSWLPELLRAFNAGDLDRFNAFSAKYKFFPDLATQQERLHYKIRLLSLMEMAYIREANKRQMSFQEIAQQARVELAKVEHLVMKALSLGLVKGYIDQVDARVSLDWVQPRVLDRKQIGEIGQRLQQWSKGVGEMQLVAEKEAEEILTQ